MSHILPFQMIWRHKHTLIVSVHVLHFVNIRGFFFFHIMKPFGFKKKKFYFREITRILVNDSGRQRKVLDYL